MAKDDVHRKKVYHELFEKSNTSNINVGNFLTEFIANVFPEKFLGESSSCKNKKILNQKIH